MPRELLPGRYAQIYIKVREELVQLEHMRSNFGQAKRSLTFSRAPATGVLVSDVYCFAAVLVVVLPSSFSAALKPVASLSVGPVAQ